MHGLQACSTDASLRHAQHLIVGIDFAVRTTGLHPLMSKLDSQLSPSSSIIVIRLGPERRRTHHLCAERRSLLAQ